MVSVSELDAGKKKKKRKHLKYVVLLQNGFCKH